MKVLYSGFLDPAHSSYGGYHKITNFPSCDRSLLCHNYLFGKIDKKYHLRKIPLWLLDFHTRMLRYKYDITHLYYGEVTMYPFFPYIKSKKHKTVITLHLDIEKQHLHSFFLKNLLFFDGIIVLSTQQQNYYKEKYGINTTFIPHGFDKPLFIYTLPKDKNGYIINQNLINIITIGKNYRDFNTLRKVISKFQDRATIHFHIVGVPTNIKEVLSSYNNVSVYDRLNNNEYFSLIQACDYNFLPVTFATANNALLEAQALGVRSILPNIPGILDYSAPKPLNLFYSNLDELYSVIDKLKKTKPSEKIIEFSKRFNWHNIYHQLNDFYVELLKR